tara:strand:+ start:97 stop:627 length:531 start_codon:yes stop_codon:yes gene_type:complete
MMDCAVCQETHKSVLEIIPCKHFFCSTCLYKWFDKKHNCPLCRGSFSLVDVNVKYFRNGIKTRREKRLIEEENFILDITKLSIELKKNHLYGLHRKCNTLAECIINKCLINIDLLLNSTNKLIQLTIEKLIQCPRKNYCMYVFANRDKYIKLMVLLKDEIKKFPTENVIITGPVIV